LHYKIWYLRIWRITQGLNLEEEEEEEEELGKWVKDLVNYIT
jgi:hypothetical protein